MAKKSKNGSSVSEPTIEHSAIEELRHAFYQKANRVTTLTDEELISLDDESEATVDQWFDRITSAEQEKLRKTVEEERSKARQPGGLSILQLGEKVNSDKALQDLVTDVSRKDMASKAPAYMAWRITQDMSKRERQLSFAIPYSNEEKGTDEYKNKLSDNERGEYAGRWDRYYHKAHGGIQVEGYWFLDWAKTTSAGAAIAALIDATNPATQHADDRAATITVDGQRTNVKTLGDEPRKKLYGMLKQRLDAVADYYRKSVQVLRQMDAFEERLGNQYDKDGNLTKIGIVNVDFVWLDPQDMSKGLTPSKSCIRLTPIWQEDIFATGQDKDGKEVKTRKFKAGDLQGVSYDLLVSEFVNIDINQAYEIAGKAGRERPTAVEIKDARRVKPEPTPKGKTPTATEASTIKPSVVAMRNMFNTMRLELEGEKFRKLWTDTVFVGLDKDAVRQLCYDVVEFMNWLDKDVVTNEVTKVHDEVLAEKNTAEQKERDEKLARQAH